MRKNRGFTLLELLIVVVILGVLALIAAPTLLNAANKAKEGAVKANASAAASTVTTYLTVDELDGTNAAANAEEDLNAAGTADDTEDDAISPFDPDLEAYVVGAEGGAGQVSLDGADYSVTIRGWNKTGDTELITKTVSAPQEASS